MSALLEPSPSRPRTRAQRPRARQRGVVLVLTLLASIFLGALVFYVFNLGQGTRSRIETQHAADAAAVAGAGWTARSMNTVAMNNVAMTRQLALVNVLDALPKTVAYTHTDQRAMLEALRDQLRRGTGPEPWVREALQGVEQELTDQVRWLEEADAVFTGPDSYDVRELTYYQTPGGDRGKLWQAMQAMDAFNEATIDSMDAIVAAATRHAARANLSVEAAADEEANDAEPSSARAGLLLRAEPPIDARRGSFEDFQGPLDEGLTPRARARRLSDDWYRYRGPFDAVFGWRWINWRIERDDPPDSPVTDGFNSSWSDRPLPLGPIVDREAISYTPYGMHQWLTRQFRWLNYRPHGVLRPHHLGSRGPLRYSGFHVHLAEISDIKLGFSPFREQIGRRVVEPRWIDYPDAVALRRARREAEPDELDQLPEIHEYRFIELSFTQHRFIVGGVPLGPPELRRWSIRVRDIDEDAPLRPPGLSRQRRYMWRDEQIERPPELVQQGLEVRRLHYFVFGGANVGQRVEVGNPWNFADRDELPAPVDFDYAADSSQPDRLADGGLRFLAVARQPRVSPMWTEAFDRDMPGSQLAVAQASVFNNHSWDLWTQMWHAQLQPVDDLGDWLARLEADPWDTVVRDPFAPPPPEAEEMYQELRSMRELAPLWLDH